MFATEGRCYLSERILVGRIGLVWLLLLGAALLTTADPLMRLPWLALACGLFILAFRLWDDLADLDYDRSHHPQRCLLQSDDLRLFRVTQWILLAGVAGLLLSVAGSDRALAFLVLSTAMLVMYRATDGRPSLRPLRVVMVLAKYPAFILLLAQHPGKPTALLVALGVYLLPLLDEVRATGRDILLPAAALLALATLAWLTLTI